MGIWCKELHGAALLSCMHIVHHTPEGICLSSGPLSCPKIESTYMFLYECMLGP